MPEFLQFMQPIGTALDVGIIMGLIQILKGVGLPSRYAGLVAIAIGLAVAYAAGGTIMDGLVAGLTAAGVYSATKAVMPKEIT